MDWQTRCKYIEAVSEHNLLLDLWQHATNMFVPQVAPIDSRKAGLIARNEYMVGSGLKSKIQFLELQISYWEYLFTVNRHRNWIISNRGEFLFMLEECAL